VSTFVTFTIVGIVTGAIYAVAATGLVVTYTTSGIFNFAHGAIGMFMAFMYWELRVHRHWPAPIALIVVLFILSPLLGAAIELVLMRKLNGLPTEVTLVVTLALLVILLGLAQTMWSGQVGRRLPEFFAGHDVQLAHVRVSYHNIIVLGVAALIAGALRFLMFHTRTGVTMRAVVDNQELAGLNGIFPERMARFSWALGSMLAAVAGILIAPTITLNHVLLTLLVVNGYAAAMLGKLKSLPLTFIGALVLGLAQTYLIDYGSNVHIGSFRLLEASPVVPTIFLFGILVFMPQARLRAGRIAKSRPPRVPTLVESLVGAGLLVAGTILLSGHDSEFWLFNLALSMVIGIVMLSLVLLSGYAGQVSLMQMTFVGLGAVAAARIVHSSSIVGVLVAGVVAAVLGALVALPALRLQDLYLALTTLALALFGDWAFTQSWGFGGVGGILTMKRLQVGGVAFKSERAQLILMTTAFALIGLFVLALRRGRYGRRLAAMRDSPVAAGMLGMNLVTVKATVFALSAGIAGMAGALFGGLRVTASANDFVFLQSLFLFLVATIGGITTVSGALFGGLFLGVMPELQKHVPIHNFQYLGIGLAAISLADNRHGFGGTISQLGDMIRGLRGGRRRGGDGDIDIRTTHVPGALDAAVSNDVATEVLV
jgi:branched-chain amino acid transport system permease protein